MQLEYTLIHIYSRRGAFECAARFSSAARTDGRTDVKDREMKIRLINRLFLNSNARGGGGGWRPIHYSFITMRLPVCCFNVPRETQSSSAPTEPHDNLQKQFGFDWRRLISRTGNERGTIAEGGGIELSLACVKQ